MGKINSNYQTNESAPAGGALSNDNPKTRSPMKRGKAASPMRSLRPKSPSMKNKS